MNDSAAEASLAGEMLRQVDRIVIAGKLGKADDVFIFDRLANRSPHADRKIFEIERLKQLHGSPPRAEAGEWRRRATPRFRHTKAAAQSDRLAIPASPCARTGECLR